MRLIRQLLRIAGQVAGQTARTGRAGVLVLVLAVGLVIAVGVAVQAIAPVAIYPFI